MRRLEILSTLSLALLLFACSKTSTPCGDDVLFLKLSWDAYSAAADQLNVLVTVGSGDPIALSFEHTVGATDSTIQLPYSVSDEGQAATYKLSGVKGGATLGGALVSTTLTHRCVQQSVSIAASVEPDMTVIPADMSSTDLAGTITWTAQNSNRPDHLRSIWGSSPSDLYVVGDGATVLHSTGDGHWYAQTVSVSGMPIFYSVWGANATHIYLVGDNGAIFFSNGSGSWSSQSSSVNSTLYRIWGASASDLFAVGDAGVILHSTGNGSWSQLSTNVTAAALFAVWGSGPSDVFVGGDGGAVLHGGVSGFSPLSLGSDHGISSLWGSSSSDVYAVASSFSDPKIFHTVDHGAHWTTIDSTSNFLEARDIWGSSGSNIFIVGGLGHVMRLQSGQLSEENDFGVDHSLNGVWGTDSAHVYAVGNQGTILQRP